MKSTNYIANKLIKFPMGYIFTYEDFIRDVNDKEAIIKALNRMVQAGKIAKLAKGKFYKPEVSVFGKLQPDLSQYIKDLLEDNGQIIGYITGYSIYNQLGLTTQISNTIQIGKNEVRSSIIRDRYTISFIKQKNIITKDNIALLQLLDAIRYIKKIPDTTIELSCKRFLAIIKKFSLKDKQLIVKLALKYPPATRAILGAFLEEIGYKELSDPLQKSLNPITSYKLLNFNKIIAYAKNWNIQ